MNSWGLAGWRALFLLAQSGVYRMIHISRVKQCKNRPAMVALKRIRPFVLRDLHHDRGGDGAHSGRVANRAFWRVMFGHWQVIDQVARVTHRKTPKASRN